jgi:hypothetical protein
MSTEILGRDESSKPREVRTDASGRLVLAPAATWAGASLTLSTTGVAIGAAANYAGGILVTNTEAVGGIAMYLSTSVGGCEVAATRYYLAGGASVVIPVASPAAIFARSASGTPLLSYIGAS